MEEILDFIVRYRYLVLFAIVFGEQIGLPIPALPFLLAAGALVRSGQLDFAAALLIGVAASVLADAAWYELGRRRGIRVLKVLCRVSLEPDSCVRRTEELFARHGARSLLIAKFLPGYSTAAPPLAGVFGMRVGSFLLYSTLGAVLWLVALGGLGWAFGHQLEDLVERLSAWSANLGAGLVALLAAYVAVKYVQRRRFLRDLRIARITPAELARRLAAGEDLAVIDLRHAVEFEADPETLPGALHVPVEDVGTRSGEIPRDRELVLLCT